VRSSVIRAADQKAKEPQIAESWWALDRASEVALHVGHHQRGDGLDADVARIGLTADPAASAPSRARRPGACSSRARSTRRWSR
jgi:hypothetical protein